MSSLTGHSATLYASTVLIWGTTWFAIKFQLGEISPELSIAYRFSLAAAILMVYCLARGLPMRFSGRTHLFMALQGLFLFGLNYLAFYWATALVTSGLIAVLFSTIVFMNMVNAAWIFGQTVDRRVAVGALLGLFGIVAIFSPELQSFDMGGPGTRGLVLSIIGTALASFGNMISVRNHRNKVPVVQSNAFGMAYGSLMLLAYAGVTGLEFAVSTAPAYVISLLYLSIFGSILGFGGYLTLLGRIGADRAAYATVLFPVVALLISTFFEDYRWTLPAFVGAAAVLVGNFLVLHRPREPVATSRR